ncbi:hypothetical protein XENOCAPTIV_022059 [Xenoophorus captivus]|uniref:Uncharacterized protein n=1 Tax=Xenoophorus captivus TaxID=1517983 RepID=A0ABV0QT29_9TELE
MNESTGYTYSDSFVLILVHMIDDRMTLLELCLFASKETLARCASPVPVPQRSSGRERFLGKGVLYTASGIMGSPLLPPISSVAGSRLNAIYFESSRKVCTASFMLYPWLWVPTPFTYSLGAALRWSPAESDPERGKSAGKKGTGKKK